MKLEKFKKNKKQKYMLIGGVVGILLVIGSIILYKTYAYYDESKTYNVLQGKIGDFGYVSSISDAGGVRPRFLLG